MEQSYDPELAGAVTAMPDLDLTDPVGTRKNLAAAARAGPVPEGVEVRDVIVAGTPDVGVRVYEPRDLGPDPPVLIYLHGGGFVLGDLSTAHPQAAELAGSAGVAVVSVDYRLAPENPFPAALLDCYAVLEAVAAGKVVPAPDTGSIGLAGDSAGACLAAGTALLARDRGGPPIRFQCLIMPVLDNRLSTPSMREFTDTPFWDRSKSELSWRHYLSAGTRRGGEDWLGYAAPARAEDLTDLPPAYLATCAFDPLRDEGLEFGRQLIRAGVPVEIHHYPGTFHGCTMIPHAGVSRRMRADTGAAARRNLLPR